MLKIFNNGCAFEQVRVFPSSSEKRIGLALSGTQERNLVADSGLTPNIPYCYALQVL